MNALANLIAPIMVIGTILALIFAMAALWNSMHRRRIIAAAQEENDEPFSFRPPPEQPVNETPTPSPATPTAAKPAAVKPSTDKPAATGEPLFRQITRAGGIPEHPVEPEGDLYVWE